MLIFVHPAGQGSESTNCPPRLWCGMGDGKVRVFDATNWALEQSFVQTKATVVSDRERQGETLEMKWRKRHSNA